MVQAGRIDRDKVAAISGERIDWRFKGMPAAAQGRSIGEVRAAGLSLCYGFLPPLVVLDGEAIEHNLDRDGRLLRPARVRPRAARQDHHGAAALRAPVRPRRVGPDRRDREPAAGVPRVRRQPGHAGQRARRPGRAGLARRRARRRPGLPVQLLGRLRARGGADDRGAARGRRGRSTCWSSWAPRTRGPACATSPRGSRSPRRWRPPRRCAWSASAATRARSRTGPRPTRSPRCTAT